jgi:hypothetical protein
MESDKPLTGEKTAGKIAQISAFRQFLVLSLRNIVILTRDRSSLILMLLIAPGVGALDLVMAPLMGKGLFSYVTGDAGNASLTLFLWCVYVLLVGAMSQMREFIKEAHIYKRERLVNLRIFPYVASKVWVALLLALYHAMAFTIIHYVAFKLPGDLISFFEIYVTLLMGVIVGMMIGLLASVISRDQGSTPMIMIMLTVPLYIFSGALTPIPDYMSMWATTRWTFQGLVGITGMGSDVARDPCWQLPKELRDDLTLDDKAYFQCPCMGVKLFEPNSCNFPGLGDLSVAEVFEPAPTEPPPLPDAPPEPIIPPPPDPLTDPSNQVQVVEYLGALKQYQDDVTNIQNNYRSQMDFYQNTMEIYQAHMVQYQEDLARYTVTRVTAVSSGEGTIDGMATGIAWAWVDKHDPVTFFRWLLKTWEAQCIIGMVYFCIILVLVKMKDAH